MTKAAMEGEEGSQQPQLVLGDKLFLLRQPDVQDIDKVRYKEDVFTHINQNGNSLSLSLSSPVSFSHLKHVLTLLSFQIWSPCMKP